MAASAPPHATCAPNRWTEGATARHNALQVDVWYLARGRERRDELEPSVGRAAESFTRRSLLRLTHPPNRGRDPGHKEPVRSAHKRRTTNNRLNCTGHLSGTSCART